jgi:hypothetical protein
MESKKYNLTIFLVSLLILTLSSHGFAQEWISGLTYQISFPSGDTKQFTDETSFYGFGLDFRKPVDRYTTVGFMFGWNVFNQRVTKTTELETENPITITGLQDRTLNSFPIMLNAHRYLGQGKDTRLYIGLNAGGYYMLQRFSIGINTFQKDQWQWGIIPEIGFVMPLQGGSTLILNGKYNYAFTGESPLGGEINHEYWTIGIGFAWSQY